MPDFASKSGYTFKTLTLIKERVVSESLSKDADGFLKSRACLDFNIYVDSFSHWETDPGPNKQ